jgi:hypothetical protein
MALGIQQAGASLAEAYGVPFDDVIQDIAESGEEVAKYFSGMPKDAVKTTVQLKAMGLSLKQAGKMADHLLDIEASLKAETKAQIMLNKNINLDKARQLAAEGKIAEAAAEATRQIGSAAEFAKMDQFQKKAAAEAAGLTLEELSKTYIMQEKMANMSQEQKDLVEKYGDKLGDISKLDKDQTQDIYNNYITKISYNDDSAQDLFFELDSSILEKIYLFKEQVALVDNINSTEENKLLTLVPSNLKKFLLNKNIELFINIYSYQEMTEIEIINYFEIIKNNKSKLYCCNREYKKLPGGEEIYFDKYPFSDAKKIFYENCPWYKKFYSIKKLPFIFNYDGNHKHCLIEFNL